MPEPDRAGDIKVNYYISHTPALLGVVIGGLVGALGILLVVLKQEHTCHDGEHVERPVFKSIAEHNLITRDRDSFSRSIDVSLLRTFSFLVHNEGSHPVVVQLELSPDGNIWHSFGELPYVLNAGEKHLFVPQYFLRYARIKFRNKIPGRHSVITVWFQGQS